MRLLFASGDVGGARAIRPVAVAASGAGHDVLVVRNGYIATQPPVPRARWIEPSPETGPSSLAALVSEMGPDAVCFATSVRDELALGIAASAQVQSVPVIHVLDNWTSYRRRLERDGVVVQPDIYAVMDDIAARAVADAGFASTSIRVTGTPALSALAPLQPPPPSDEGLRLVFVSEPVEMDQGSDPASMQYRGYVETTVLSLLAQSLTMCPDVARIDILPHPREDAAQLEASWHAVRGALEGDVIAPFARDGVLARASGIVGMSSILLYEMWLRGRPVASLQPGLRLPELRMLSGKPGLAFFEDAGSAIADLQRWKDQIATYSPTRESVMERARHEHSAQAILGSMVDIVTERRRATL